MKKRENPPNRMKKRELPWAIHNFPSSSWEGGKLLFVKPSIISVEKLGQGITNYPTLYQAGFHQEKQMQH